MENKLSTVENRSSGYHERIINIRTDHREESFQHVRIGRKMHKVSPPLRLKKHHHLKNIYDPVIVSIGPYHHGNSSFQQAEKLKSLCVRWFSLRSKEKEMFFLGKIMEKIQLIRSSYADVSILERYSDGALARMMLRDACFIINHMANVTELKRYNNITDWRGHFGWSAVPFMTQDIMKLENQVPFLVLKLLISLQQGEEWEELLHDYLVWLLLRKGSKVRVRIPREDEDPPLHLLEAVWRAVTQNEDDDPVQKTSRGNQYVNKLWQKIREKGNKTDDNDLRYHAQFNMFQSVTDLKAKGIYCRPSSSYTFKAVRFKSRSYYGELQLPVRFLSDQHVVILSNLIAYELSPDTNTDYTALSYTIFIKSLIETPEDVKELQKRGILFNKYLNHEQVVKSYKEIDTYGFVHTDVFGDVKERIGEHCRNRAKTWVADLIHTRLQSPWSIMALFAATFILCLTALQTFYSIIH